ncbi:hypothetical protein SNE40_023354 [Patella caerulea]|uniref:Uncharacterized protein n=1 Tax=Patella caerulea TaxID=87958 RepID=A0AAN8G722_PATCE
MSSGTLLVAIYFAACLSGAYPQRLSPKDAANLLLRIQNSQNPQVQSAPAPQVDAASLLATIQNPQNFQTGPVPQTFKQSSNIQATVPGSQTQPSSIDQLIQTAQPASFNRLIQQIQKNSPKTQSSPQQQAPNSPSNFLPFAATGMIDGPMANIAAASALSNRPGPLGTMMASNVLDVGDTGRGLMLMNSLRNQQPGKAGSQPSNNAMGNYLTARAFDMGDTASNMMLLGGMNSNNQNPPNQQQKQQRQQQQQPFNLFGGGPMGNYMTARAFDFGDFMTNMMLFNGMGQQQQQLQPPQQQTQQTRQQQQQRQVQSTFDPMLAMLWAM